MAFRAQFFLLLSFPYASRVRLFSFVRRYLYTHKRQKADGKKRPRVNEINETSSKANRSRTAKMTEASIQVDRLALGSQKDENRKKNKESNRLF